MHTNTERQGIVIIGGGFGGIAAAKALKNAPVDITLIDRNNYHLFQPLLYQVATGELSPADIASPLRRLLKQQPNVRILMGEVVGISATSKQLRLADGSSLPYDQLIVAAGSRSHYFGKDSWQEYAPGLKSIQDATEIRRRILRAFEAAEICEDPEEQRRLLTFAIIGGGATGVELAGAVAEIAHQTYQRGFHQVRPSTARVLLIQSRERILPSYHPSLSARAAASLQGMGVEIITGARVIDVGAEGVTLRQGETERFIATETSLWAVGVKASPLGHKLARVTGAELDSSGRVIVQPDCSLPGHPEIFVIGDLAHHRDSNGQPLPGVAQVAIQQGRYVGKHIQQQLRGKTSRPFRYANRGDMATIGRGAAIAEIGRLRVSGWLAWQIWLFVHLMYLLDSENRVLVGIQWLWNFFTGNRSALLIIDPDQPALGVVEARYATDTGSWPAVS